MAEAKLSLWVRGLARRLLPKKTYFTGVDIGTAETKVAEVRLVEGVPVVVSLRKQPSPPGVWTETCDEEQLIAVLRSFLNPRNREVVTCIGGERLISRLVRFPRLEERELEEVARHELEGFVPVPLERLLVRAVYLEEPQPGEERPLLALLLATPAELVYECYSIFARAGFVVTAVDCQAFALWRLYGKDEEGTVGILEIGARSSLLLVGRAGILRFVRSLPVGADSLAGHLAATQALGLEDLGRLEGETGVPLSWEGELLPLVRELERSLSYLAAQEGLSPEKLVLSGGGCKALPGLPEYLRGIWGISVEVGYPPFEYEGTTFDPAFSVALGLAVRDLLED